MARTIAVGEQDFGKIIEQNYFYIDKTNFIKEWWENGDAVTLITRPRRFGKTLTMRMTEQFFSRKYQGRNDLFENLNIWKEKRYRILQGTYPVIFLSFADVKGNAYEEVYADICRLVAREYRRHVSLLESDCFLQADREQFYKIMSQDASTGDICSSLNQLSEYLYAYYGRKVILLLDEYDAPMQEAYVNGFWEKLAGFMRKFMNSSFKTNTFLERAVMTGITRVSKESVFSDLNNLTVVTTTSRKYETVFGFTEQEVSAALEEFGLQDEMCEVRRWYDGFRFGDCRSIYNPWSITQYLDEKKFAPYWANTSSNKLIGRIIQEGRPGMKTAVEDLLHGRAVCTAIDEQVVFDQLDESDEAVWSLLLAGGYLKITDIHPSDKGHGLFEEPAEYELMLTNLEIGMVFQKMIRGWFGVCRSSYNDFIKALLKNDLESMNGYLNSVALDVSGSFDSGRQPSGKMQPEKFYHGLVLGIMLDLRNQYVITSNRESGFGRYDLLFEPRSLQDDGIIFEFKVYNPGKEKSLEDTARTAILQILDKKYAALLREKGVPGEKIRVYGFAFRGKEVLVEGGYLREFEGVQNRK